MALPITLRSWGGSDLSQSLTGSLPLSDLKKQTFNMGFISNECTIFDTLSQMMRLARSCKIIQVVIKLLNDYYLHQACTGTYA